MKNKTKSSARKGITAILFAVIMMVSVLAVIPSVEALYPAARIIVLSEDSDVTVTFQSSEAACNNQFGLWSPDRRNLGWGHSTPPGTVFNLGRFSKGTELIFFIYHPCSGNTWLNGPGERNGDGEVHAATSDLGVETWQLGFEDLPGGGDRDFNDIILVVKGDLYIAPPYNQPPLADAGPDQNIEQTYYQGADVTLDGSGSSDPDGDPLTYSWTWAGGSATGVSPTVSLPLGTTTITLTVNDGEFTDVDTVVVNVVDTAPPVITCPVDVKVEQETRDGTVVPLTATATDICDADVEITSDAPAIFPLGTTTVTFTATDNAGNSASCSMTVTVEDTTPPVITPSGEQIVLWPPNHKYRTVEISDCVISVTDICDAGVGIDDIVITSVSSDEPENIKGKGDGNTVDDIVIVDSQTVELRAERQGAGNGRVYTINFEVTDASGNTATGSCTVWVPHDQGSGSTAIDDGASAGYTVNYP